MSDAAGDISPLEAAGSGSGSVGTRPSEQDAG